MKNALSLHIGLNSFNKSHYNEAGTLAGCENDARDMAALAKKQGYTPVVPTLFTKKATAAAVTAAIRKAAKSLKPGGTFFITYAGHGSQIPDTNGDEKDRRDETWCLYDRMFIDDEMAALWATFQSGVRIIMLSDSCHSGTVSRGTRTKTLIAPPRGRRCRLLPENRAFEIYKDHKDVYDAIQFGTKAGLDLKINASVLLISGCQDTQLSGDGDLNGLFTETLKAVWDDGNYDGTYRTLRDDIAARMPKYQQPRYSLEGSANSDFEQERPFSPAGSAQPRATKTAGIGDEKKKSATPIEFVLSALQAAGLKKPTAKSDLRAWVKKVEKEDKKMGLPASRVDVFLSRCFERYPALPLEKKDITSGTIRTPADLVKRLQPDSDEPGSRGLGTRTTRGGGGGVTASFSGATLITAGLTKEDFLTQNKAALATITTAVNNKLRTAYGTGHTQLTRHDMCVVFYCECGLKSGKVDPDHTHSEGERGMLPLPENIKSWNGSDAPAWNQPMSAVVNVEHFFLYMGHLKNKDLTGAPRHLYGGLFKLDVISGNATIGAKLLAGIVHGYFYSGTYTDKKVPFDYLVKSYQADERLSVFMKPTKYIHAGTSVMTGREKNIDTGLGLV